MLTEFTAVGNDTPGFDDESAHDPWVLVRLGFKRQLSLWNADGMRVQGPDPAGVASFTSLKDQHGRAFNEQVIQFEGLNEGRAQIEVNGVPPHTDVSSRRSYSTPTRAGLTIRVLPERRVYLNFFRVTDQDGNMPRFVPAQAQDICDDLTEIYLRQANVRFYLHLATEVNVDVDFATEFQTKDQNEAILDAVDKMRIKYDDAPGHKSVFWVKKYGAGTYLEDGVKHDVIGGTHIGAPQCIIEDYGNPQEQLALVAHEIGHCLGADHDNVHDSALMYPYNSPSTKIYRRTVEQLHR